MHVYAQCMVLLSLLLSLGCGAGGVETAKNSTEVKNRAPVLILKGKEKISLYVSESYVEPGYQAEDVEDGNLTARVEVSLPDMKNEGHYKVIYSVKDSAGVIVEKSRDIEVLAVLDDINITLIKESALGDDVVLDMWEYLLPFSSTTNTVNIFNHRHKESVEKDEIIIKSGQTAKIQFDYTHKILQYQKDEENITISFVQNEIVEKKIVLKRKVKISEELVRGGDSSCSVTMHYAEVVLASIHYQDVIKLECPSSRELFFVKGVGLVIDNRFESMKQEAVILKENNLKSMKKVHAENLYKAPYFLTGKGIKVGVVDGGNVRSTHQEFIHRVENIDHEDISQHTTHVVGTIAAKGVDSDARGFASGAKVIVDTFKHLYNEKSMRYLFEQYGIDISNHSYGSGDDLYQGVYDWDAHMSDAFVASHPTLIAVKSAGNDRSRGGYSDYSCIKRVANAKNIITVGSIDADDKISYFSSVGPVKNGRIKPDIVAQGRRIKSAGTDTDTSYVSMSGTSMSAPAVTGVLVLMQEAYQKVNHQKMREDIAKGILVNCAQDLGNKGPDAEYGYGLVDALCAIQTIYTMSTPQKSTVSNQSISKNSLHTYTIELDKPTLFKATLSWIDSVEAYSDLGVDLFVDLDLSVIDESGHIYYTYHLDGNAPAKLAKRDSLNHVDNVEQVEVGLPKGRYHVLVSTYKVPKADQPYSLVSNLPLGKVQKSENLVEIRGFETLLYHLSHDD